MVLIAGIFGRLLTCEGKFDFRSLCIQAGLIDILNLLLLVIFFYVVVLLIIGLVGKKNVFMWKTDLFTTAISIFSAIVGSAYFGAGFGFFSISSLTLFGSLSRGLTWITFSLSLFVQGCSTTRWINFLISVWWVVFFLLISALNVEILVRNHGLHVLEVVSWFGSFLLLFCAVKKFHGLAGFRRSRTAENGLREPLLTQQDGHCAIGHASFFGKLSFSWINPLLRVGSSRTLSLEDVPSLNSEDEAATAYEKFRDAWKEIQRGKEKNSNDQSDQNLVLWAILKVYWKEIVLAGILAFLRAVAVSSTPLLLFAFISYCSSETKNLDKGLILVGLLVLVKIVDSLSYRNFYFYSKRIGMRIRSALMVAIYKKQLKLSSLGRRRHSTGEIVNYIAVDAYRMGDLVMWFNMGWSSVQLVLSAIGIVFGVAGLGVLLGMIPLLICGVLNVPFAKILQKCHCEFMAAQDKRLRSTSEILNNMKIIKLQSWEEKFKNIIELYRESEFKWLKESQYCKTYNSVLYWMSPTIVSSVIFFGCILFSSSLFNATTIFTVLSALRTMGEPVRIIPEALSYMIQFKVSFERINSFLQEDEIKKVDTVRRTPAGEADLSIFIQGGNFSWDPDSGTETIRNVNMEMQKGKKVAVCGPVGAGKSSLLYAILGEIPKKSGTVSNEAAISVATITK